MSDRGNSRTFRDQSASAAQFLDIRGQGLLRVLIDERPDVGRWIGGIADPERRQGAADQLQHARRDFVLQVQHAQRTAALPGGAKSARHDRIDDLFGQRRGIDDHCIQAAGFGDQRRDRTLARRERNLDSPRGRVAAGEDYARDTRVFHQRAADGSVARQQVERIGRHSGFEQPFGNAMRHQRRLLGRLRHHGVAGDQRGRHLPGEYRHWKIPRTDAREHAAPVQRQAIAFTCRAAQLQRPRHGDARLLRVVATEVHRLAHVGNRVGQGLARFQHAKRDQGLHVRLEAIREAIEYRRARFDAGVGPREPRGVGARDGRARDRRRRIDNFTDAGAGVCRSEDLARGPRLPASANHRRRRPGTSYARRRGRECGKRFPATQVVSNCDPSFGHVQLRWHWQHRRGFRAGKKIKACREQGPLIRGARSLTHERRAGAVLQQTANEVREQIIARADWRIHPHGHRWRHAPQTVLESRAHAVQALTFEVPRSCQRQHAGQRHRIVRRELHEHRL